MFKKSACFPPPKDAEHPPESFGVGGFFKSPRGLCALVGSTQPIHAPRNRKHRAPRDAKHPVKSFAGLGAFSKAPKVFWYLVFCLSPDNIRRSLVPPPRLCFSYRGIYGILYLHCIS